MSAGRFDEDQPTHNSRSVFDRYNIVSETDLADAASNLEKRTDPTTDPGQAA